MEALGNMVKIAFDYVAAIPDGVLGFIAVAAIVVYLVRNVLD